MRRWQADLALVFITLIWGSTFVVVKNSLDLVGPLVFVASRFWIASFALLILFLFHRKGLSWQLVRDGGLVGCFLTLGYVTQTIGLQTTEAGKAAFITGLSAVLVPVFAAWFLHQPSSRSAVAGILLATVGLALMTLDRSLHLATGDLWVLACALGFALHITTVAHVASRHAVLPFTLMQLSTGAILTSIAALWFEAEALLPPQPAWPAILYMGLVATAFVFGVQTWGQRHTTATHTALIFALEPVFAAITAALFADEVLVAREWLGGALILIGMVVAELGDMLFHRRAVEFALESGDPLSSGDVLEG
ncbi:MAG: DMT family transporter [Anaerolineae bacterium]|jgi:drug/metabolite transporter (DMT)-like permease|nr:DMT family transporter [Anaerolineae bacterium]